MRSVILFIALALFGGGLVAPVQAQLELNQSTASLDIQPRFPEPQSTVRVELNDFALGARANTISWRVNGAVVPEVANQRTISVLMGELGETVTVTAQVQLTDGQFAQASETITPSHVAIVVEPVTRVPFWYPGRPLPSVGSEVRATAVVAGNGGASASYTWRLDDTVINSGGSAQSNTTRFTMPFGRGATLTVTVQDANGNSIARRSVVVPNVEPELYFYTVNPLRGQSQLAIPGRIPMVGEEMVIRAEPFHLSSNLASNNTLFEWQVNGQMVENPDPDQLRITLRNGGGIGGFTVAFHIRNLEQLLQGVEDEFSVFF